MSYEEDYLLSKIRELEDRLSRLEASCPGTRSETSTARRKPSEPTRSSSDPAPAPTTESLSKKGLEESFTAPSTDGPGTAERTAEQRPAQPGQEYGTWTYRALLDELRARGLPRNGNMSELAERLEADDLSRAV